jgi:hypothetical protein
MANEIVFIVEEAAEGGYQATAIGHSIVTEAATLDELKKMIRDAVCCHFEDCDKPVSIRLHLIKEEVIPS